MGVALHHPESLTEALDLLRAEPEAAFLAGGASMVAMMNAKLVEPKAVVSLRRIPELQGISLEPGGGLRIGAMTRHCDTALDARLTGPLATVRLAAVSIASPPVRNVGTMGGSIALSDPAADYPAALVVSRARIELASVEGRRSVDAREFFLDWYTTALEPGELIVAIHLPGARPGVGIYEKFARTAGDFAIVSMAVVVDEARSVRVAVGACGPIPIVLDEADELLSSGIDDPVRVRRAGELLAAAADPTDDVRASADYRRLLIPRLLSRVAAAANDGMGSLR